MEKDKFTNSVFRCLEKKRLLMGLNCLDVLHRKKMVWHKFCVFMFLFLNFVIYSCAKYNKNYPHRSLFKWLNSFNFFYPKEHTVFPNLKKVMFFQDKMFKIKKAIIHTVNFRRQRNIFRNAETKFGW